MWQAAASRALVACSARAAADDEQGVYWSLSACRAVRQGDSAAFCALVYLFLDTFAESVAIGDSGALMAHASSVASREAEARLAFSGGTADVEVRTTRILHHCRVWRQA